MQELLDLNKSDAQTLTSTKVSDFIDIFKIFYRHTSNKNVVFAYYFTSEEDLSYFMSNQSECTLLDNNVYQHKGLVYNGKIYLVDELEETGQYNQLVRKSEKEHNDEININQANVLLAMKRVEELKSEYEKKHEMLRGKERKLNIRQGLPVPEKGEMPIVSKKTVNKHALQTKKLTPSGATQYRPKIGITNCIRNTFEIKTKR